MKLTNADFVARISSASKVNLIAITYELIFKNVDDAVAAQGNQAEFAKPLGVAVDLLGTLIDSLDMKYELSRTLFPLYIYVNKLLIQAKVSGRTEGLSDVKKILTPLLEGWQEVAKNEENPTPLMEKSQTIYAGLTYGRGELQEYIAEDTQKSFKA